MKPALEILEMTFESVNPINRLAVMIKAKDFLHSENHVEFKFANSPLKVGGLKANHVKMIAKEDGKSFTLVFGNIRKVKMFGVSMPEYKSTLVIEDVKIQDVKSVFEQTTGFLTSIN